MDSPEGKALMNRQERAQERRREADEIEAQEPEAAARLRELADMLEGAAR